MSAPAKKKARQIDTGNMWVKAMDEALEKHPPVITWAPNGRGVMVATSIDDPHADTGSGRNTDKQVCKRNHPFDEVNTIHKPDGSRQCRTCKALWAQKRRVA